jgi:hypothetical protein
MALCVYEYLYIMNIYAYIGKLWLNTWGLADDTTVCVVNLEHAGAPLGVQ